ncbi:cysteine hydrolase family protein [Reyranella sp. CPCC 100927]|uniref:cysteine hydrolase family protein n=1 Tax=Reyranella sp. CPCC 100927 TaxID=2599616 RepID=UPI0011B465CD|nr:cysteine hydrolase family protein [Reyranella sp. CPCC 100927]TWT09473.1 cysteine hydrolase [Reyranella sp. CPCC 100927]
MAKTLLQLANADLTPAKVGEAAIVLIDIQNEYLEGPIALPDAQPAVAAARRLLDLARRANAPIFHIAHRGRPGSLFDREGKRGQIVDELAPLAGEAIVEKGLPNSFADTNLHALLSASGRKNLIMAGFMTHMCVSSTARVAVDLGYRVTIDASACATRDLPGLGGKIVPARILHEVALTELADRFAIIANGSHELA